MPRGLRLGACFWGSNARLQKDLIAQDSVQQFLLWVVAGWAHTAVRGLLMKWLRFLLGLVAGGLAGYVSGQFLAPASGRQNRERLRGAYKVLVAQARAAAAERRQQLERLHREAKERGGVHR
jgi:hypothetical protein